MLTCYLAGAMEKENDRGLGWRKKYKKRLKKLGIECIIPHDEEWSIAEQNDLNGFAMLDELKVSDIEKHKDILRQIIVLDLNIVSNVDIVVCKWDGEQTAGTIAEVTFSYYLDKPTYLVSGIEYKDMMSWFGACFTEQFANFDELYKYLEYKYVKVRT